MDNATNNDTLVAAFERRCRTEGIEFSSTDTRMRCMPHTIHLSALKVLNSTRASFWLTKIIYQLLEAIGALTKEEKRTAKSKSRGSVYQESATESLRREADEDAGDTEDGADTNSATPTSVIGRAVFKVL